MRTAPGVTEARGEIGAEVGQNGSTDHLVFFMDARELSQNQIHAESVELVVTSPPYGSIKDYGHPGQIGYDQEFPKYLQSLNQVWANCWRALKPGGRLCINVGDQYIRGTKRNPYHIIPVHAFIINGLLEMTTPRPLYLGSIIWQKISTTRTSGGASVMGSYGFPRNGYVSLDYEYIALFKKPGKIESPEPEVRERSRIDLETWREYFGGHWRFPGSKQNVGIATFPDELPRRLIRMFSYPGDTVLDPFLGSGTTSKVCAEEGRNSVGCEIGFRAPDGRSARRVIEERVNGYERRDGVPPASFRFAEAES